MEYSKPLLRRSLFLCSLREVSKLTAFGWALVGRWLSGGGVSREGAKNTSYHVLFQLSLTRVLRGGHPQ